MINITVLHYQSNQRRRLRPTRLVTIALLYVQHDMVSVDILKVFVFLIAPIYVVIHETNGHTEPRHIYVDRIANAQSQRSRCDRPTTMSPRLHYEQMRSQMMCDANARPSSALYRSFVNMKNTTAMASIKSEGRKRT